MVKPAEIACQQVLLHDATVYSVQSLVLPPHEGLTPDLLLARYFAHLRRFTLSAIRVAVVGDTVHFRFAGMLRPLLSFTGPVYSSTSSGRSATLRLSDGVLLQRDQCGRGQLVFAVETVPGGVRISLELSDYCPVLLGGGRPGALRKLIYRLTQAYIHRMVTVDYLARLYRELEGGCVKVVRTRPPVGEDI